MNLTRLLLAAASTGAALLAYGAMVEAKRLQVVRRDLTLRNWPKEFDGFRVVLMADPHVRDADSAALAQLAVDLARAEDPDAFVLAGDHVAYWHAHTDALLAYALRDLNRIGCPKLAIAGNHDYFGGSPARLRPILEPLGVHLLVDDVVGFGGVQWVGLDSASLGKPDPHAVLRKADWGQPVIVLWHEPDMVEQLPRGADLMLSGHSHGGQFITPWGWAPVTSRLGSRFVRGWYPEAPTPLYVSSGVGTTGFPSRLFCPPELSVLTLRAG